MIVLGTFLMSFLGRCSGIDFKDGAGTNVGLAYAFMTYRKMQHPTLIKHLFNLFFLAINKEKNKSK